MALSDEDREEIAGIVKTEVINILRQVVIGINQAEIINDDSAEIVHGIIKDSTSADNQG